MMPQILHADVDAFAVSVARLGDRALRSRPVVIGHEAGGRGIVVCASYEARNRRIFSGMPLSLARRRFPDAIYLPDDPAAYEHHSSRLHKIFKSAAITVEAATLDDFYLDVTGCEKLFGGNLVNWGMQLKRTVEGETGLPISLGLAANKMLSRIATSMAKPGHIMEVMPGHEREFLSRVSVDMLPGVGETTRTRLREYGVRLTGQLSELGEETLRMLFGPCGSELWRRSMGEFNEPVKPSALHRYIVHEHQFREDVADGAILESAAALLAQKLGAELRRNQVRCNRAEITLVYSDGLQSPHSLLVEYPTDQDFDLIAAARRAATGAFSRRVRVRRVILKASFLPHQDCQFDLFMENAQKRRRNLYQAIDEVRERHGFDALLSARSLKVSA